MGKYDSIIHNPHHVSKNRPQMALSDRAAQFAPFAALTGYDDMVKETARLVDEKRDMSEEQLMDLDFKTKYITEHIKDEPIVTITYFVPDSKKAGGKYITKEGKIKKFEKYNRFFVFTDGTIVPLADVWSIEGDELPSEW